ncbi:McrC family protein [Lentzea sp. NPDC058450]|uniref:McrC family protein n=1 Tax=Lentzea sp. NPDC058450 TaxID=3346505 RepID=UPI00366835B2
MPTVEIREQQATQLGFPLTAADLQTFEDPLLRKYFTPRLTSKGTELKVTKVIGLLRLANADLVITPKVPVSGSMLLHWLHYAVNGDHPILPRSRHWDSAGDYFPDMVVQALLEECRKLLRDQLHKDYQRREVIEPTVRGRLDVTRQVTHRYGMLDRLHVHTFDRTSEIWENEVCGAALRHAAKTANDPKLRQQARQLAAKFPSCSSERARSALARARHHLLNLRYRAAHTWAEVVLRAGGVSDLFLPRELVGDSHLLVIEQLWQRVVHRMAGSLPKIDGVKIHRNRGRQVANFSPDALVATSTGHVAADAKWKNYDDAMVSRDDIHQLLTYANAYQPSDPRAVIVYPSALPTAWHTIDVKHLGSRIASIDVVGVDVTVRPEVSATILRERFHS